jgi:hypothetical protein
MRNSSARAASGTVGTNSAMLVSKRFPIVGNNFKIWEIKW